jgi:hypothetical protein
MRHAADTTGVQAAIAKGEDRFESSYNPADV